jgi:hypothetical protein
MHNLNKEGGCPSCGGPLIVEWKCTTGGWKRVGRCMEPKSTGCPLEIILFEETTTTVTNQQPWFPYPLK